MEWAPLVIAAVPGTLAVIAIIYQAWTNKDLTDASAASKAVEAASEMIDQLRKARDYWHERALECEKIRDRMERKE